MDKIKLFLPILSFFLVTGLSAAPMKDKTDSLLVEKGKFDHWRVFELTESKVIGGNRKIIYKLTEGEDTVRGNEPFVQKDEDLFAPCNIMANVVGIIKGSNSVTPEKRGDGYCAKLQVIMEHVKVLGMINLDVIVQGTIITGKFKEPIRDTKGPYQKVDFGIPFTKRPRALQFDYKAIAGKSMIRATGLSAVKDMEVPDYPYIAVMLQHREEDDRGRITAKRVGSAFHIVDRNIPDWINGEQLKIHYGDISGEDWYNDIIGLKNKHVFFYSENSKGKLVKIHEDGWAEEGTNPTHAIIWISSSSGEAFFGGFGNTLWIDNVKFVY